MSRSFMDRRHERPKYKLSARITGISLPGGKVHWNVEIDGAESNAVAAGVLERAAQVLRDAAQTGQTLEEQ